MVGESENGARCGHSGERFKYMKMMQSDRREHLVPDPDHIDETECADDGIDLLGGVSLSPETTKMKSGRLCLVCELECRAKE